MSKKGNSESNEKYWRTENYTEFWKVKRKFSTDLLNVSY